MAHALGTTNELADDEDDEMIRRGVRPRPEDPSGLTLEARLFAHPTATVAPGRTMIGRQFELRRLGSGMEQGQWCWPGLVGLAADSLVQRERGLIGGRGAVGEVQSQRL